MSAMLLLSAAARGCRYFADRRAFAPLTRPSDRADKARKRRSNAAVLTLNYRDSRPIYEQIKDGLRRMIVTGP